MNKLSPRQKAACDAAEAQRRLCRVLELLSVHISRDFPHGAACVSCSVAILFYAARPRQRVNRPGGPHPGIVQIRAPCERIAEQHLGTSRPWVWAVLIRMMIRSIRFLPRLVGFLLPCFHVLFVGLAHARGAFRCRPTWHPAAPNMAIEVDVTAMLAK
jgi:hypothetical protein